MALTAAEEALVRELIAQNPELLSLAGNEATIISKLGATKKNLSQLAAALSLNDTDLLFTRQGTSDKSVVLSVLKSFLISGIPAASTTVSGIVELATSAETITGTDAVRAVTPAGLAAKVATETAAGIAELATTSEATAGTDDLRIMTPLKVAQSIAANTSSASVQGTFSNLKLSATGTNASVAITADAVIVRNSASGKYKTLRNVSETLNTAGSGANGLDTGTLAASTWYYVHIIAKEDDTTDSLLSLSATAPTLPATYLYSARVGAIRTDGTVNKYPLSFTQFAKRVQYKIAAGSNLTSLPTIASGAVGTFGSAWGVASTANAIPPTAAVFLLSMSSTSGGSGAIWLAPNTACGFNALGGGFYYAPAAVAATMVAINAENASVAVSSQANTAVGVFGWEDNL